MSNRHYFKLRYSTNCTIQYIHSFVHSEYVAPVESCLLGQNRSQSIQFTCLHFSYGLFIVRAGASGSSGSPGGSGAPGATGGTGASGATGPVGATGSSGQSGASGNTGASGGQGATGQAGSSGATGRNLEKD